MESPEQRAEKKRHHFRWHIDLVNAIMKVYALKRLGPRWQRCMTVNSSLSHGLENTLTLPSKASVARNTWGFLLYTCYRYTTCQVLHFSMIIGSFCFHLQSSHSSKQYPSSWQATEIVFTEGRWPQTGWLVHLRSVQGARTSSGYSGQGRELLELTKETVRRERPLPRDICWPVHPSHG